jgi:hypothetical protein
MKIKKISQVNYNSEDMRRLTGELLELEQQALIALQKISALDVNTELPQAVSEASYELSQIRRASSIVSGLFEKGYSSRMTHGDQDNENL